MGAAIAAALIGVAGSVGTTMYSANQQKKAASAAQGAAGMDTSAMGDVPKAALYEPVDFEQMQMAQVLDNIYGLPNIKGLAAHTNRFISDDAINRAKRLIPNYSQAMQRMGANTLDMLSGELPFDDVLGIVNDRATLAGATGIPGTSGGATLRDLGLSRMDAMKTGSGMLGDMVRMAEMVSPRSSYMRPQDMMLSPLERINKEIEQRQLVQQSEQNFYNLDAAANPSEVARFQLGLGGQLSGSSGGGFNPAMIAAGTDAATSLLQAFSRPSTASTTPAVAPNVVSTPNMYNYSYDASLGWTPVAKPVAA